MCIRVFYLVDPSLNKMAWNSSPSYVFLFLFIIFLCLDKKISFVDTKNNHSQDASVFGHGCKSLTHSTTRPQVITSQWVGLSYTDGTLEWMMLRVLHSYANPSLIASCERPKIHVSHCNMPQGYSAWQIKSGSLTLAGLTDVALIFFGDAQSKEWDWWGSCLMSCARSLSACLFITWALGSLSQR